MLKAIIFDCFGVLYPQSTGMFFDKHKELIQNYLKVMGDLSRKIDLGEIINDEFFIELENITGIPAKAIQDEIESKYVVDQSLISLIKKLKQKYKIGLLSNTGKEEI